MTCLSTVKLFTLSLCFISVSSTASKQCHYQARTPLEHSYCDIKARGQGATLPSIMEFRSNPAPIQRLLLTTPARKAGITLPPKEKSAPTVSPPTKAPEVVTKNTDQATSVRTNKPARSETPLGACSLAEALITCNRIRYVLKTNQPNNQLDRQALSDSNKLILEHRKAPRYSNATDLLYLSESYAIYIEKMLSIGLGDSTMSFTRFAALYQDATEQGKDFASRLAEMFELLKAEKRTKAIKPRYSDNFPKTIEHCMRATSKIIVCDNVSQNWVYTLAGE